MQRRRLLKVGMGASALLTLAAGAAWWTAHSSARIAVRLQPAARAFLLAIIGSAVLVGVLPEAPADRNRDLLAWLDRLESTVAGMPGAVQQEFDDMVLILLSAPGRLALTGLHSKWQDATPAQLQDALQGLHFSTWPLREQIFHALRDLTNAAYFATPQSWAALGYPGPFKV